MSDLTKHNSDTSHSHSHSHGDGACCHCCPDGREGRSPSVSRRDFMAFAAAGGAVLSGLSWSSLAVAAEPELPMPQKRSALKVLPILVWDYPHPRPMTSWRPWGGIHTPAAAEEEVGRITKELDGLAKAADFPVEFAKVASVNDIKKLLGSPEVKAADVVIVYGAGTHVDGTQNLGRDVIIFQRHRSGPVYLQYEIISPVLLRQHTDMPAFAHLRFDDVVTDSLDELTWRLRSLCGLKNTKSSKVICVGGPAGWAQPKDVVAKQVKDIWNLDLQTLTYDDLGRLIDEARADENAVALAKKRAGDYLAQAGTTLETKREFVDNCFLLDQVFRGVMAEAGARSLTINGCMSTIMPKALTSACLTLSTLNDDGYLAFCESDFVVIPSGILLANISGTPAFLNDPTYPHDGVITLAHCTGPRRMDGKTLQDARIVTHFESDYGAAPKCEWPKGQVVTNIVPDFKSKCWMGFTGKVVDSPFMPICRDQIDVSYDISDQLVAERMGGFHWMTGYGDHMKELGYALRRVGVKWDNLHEVSDV